MAYQTVDAVRAMEESSGVVREELKADGGAVLLAGWHRALEVTMREPAG